MTARLAGTLLLLFAPLSLNVYGDDTWVGKSIFPRGIKLEVRFMGKGDGLGDAEYYTIGEKRSPVASIERELNGRNIYKLLQERASKRSDEWLAKKTEENRIDQAARSESLRRGIRPAGGYRAGGMQPSVVTVAPVAGTAEVKQQAPVQKRTFPAEALTAIAMGSTRDDLLSRLGEPTSRHAVTDDDGARESFAYDLDSGGMVEIRLLNGKVAKVSQR